MEPHVCAVCGRPAGGTPVVAPLARRRLGHSTDGCLILYETTDGGDAWMHRKCAESRAA
jgi:hypothetical protein